MAQPRLSESLSLASFQRGALSHGDWLCIGLLPLFVLTYIVVYSAQSIYAYRIGVTLIDLATFEQSFWNATHGTPFFSSLEGNISHFDRHFSPIFVLLLPFY